MSRHHRIDYFELPATDLAAAKRFYSAAFDWRFTDYGPNYAGFGYAAADREGGGISNDPDHTRDPLAILYSDNLEASEQRVQSAGGKSSNRSFPFLEGGVSTSPIQAGTSLPSGQTSERMLRVCQVTPAELIWRRACDGSVSFLGGTAASQDA